MAQLYLLVPFVVNRFAELCEDVADRSHAPPRILLLVACRRTEHRVVLHCEFVGDLLEGRAQHAGNAEGGRNSALAWRNVADPRTHLTCGIRLASLRVLQIGFAVEFGLTFLSFGGCLGVGRGGSFGVAVDSGLDFKVHGKID